MYTLALLRGKADYRTSFQSALDISGLTPSLRPPQFLPKRIELGSYSSCSKTFSRLRMKMKFGITAVVLVMILSLGTGCGTLIHGTTQEVTITSNPMGAAVVVDGIDQGITPVSLDLSRKNKHSISVSMYGYENFHVLLDRKMSSWTILGGPVGWLVDDATGGMYNLKPNRIDVQLEPNPSQNISQRTQP